MGRGARHAAGAASKVMTSHGACCIMCIEPFSFVLVRWKWIAPFLQRSLPVVTTVGQVGSPHSKGFQNLDP